MAPKVASIKAELQLYGYVVSLEVKLQFVWPDEDFVPPPAKNIMSNK